MSRTRDQALALAGVAQFAQYAHQLAARGHCPQQRIERALQAIFSTDPENTEAVFDGAAGVVDGRRFLRAQLEGGQRADTDAAIISRYIGQILRLAGRVRRNRQVLDGLAAGIGQARMLNLEQAPTVLDEVYREHISPLKPRIMIRGEQTHLNDSRNAQRIRTLLLAAVRCGVLWRQTGGSFWRLLLKRRQLTDALIALQ